MNEALKDSGLDLVVLDKASHEKIHPPQEFEDKPVNPKAELGLRLWMTGLSMEEAALRVGTNINIISLFKNSLQGRELIERVRAETDEEFRNLQIKVNKVINDSLDHPEVAIALTAANIFLRATKGREMKIELTAEDIVQKLMGERT